MKKHFLLIMLLFALLLAACNGDAAEEADPTEPVSRPTPTTETETTAPTPEDVDSGYPAQPQATAPSAGYPAAGGESPLVTEGWVVLPAGEQCADNLAYPTSETAVAELEAAGLTPLAVEETELLVCEACGCPTSAHYRVLLSPEDMVIALSLGWQREIEG